MDAATRKAKLDELKCNQLNQAMTGIPLRYKGTTRTEIVWRIPLDFLIYNKYNGRIGSDVLSYEKQNGELNAEKDDDRKIIAFNAIMANNGMESLHQTVRSLMETVVQCS